MPGGTTLSMFIVVWMMTTLYVKQQDVKFPYVKKNYLSSCSIKMLLLDQDVKWFSVESMTISNQVTPDNGIYQ